MRIAVYGGTFDPIHNGHLEIARAAVAQGYADRTWLMVSPLNPLKSGQKITPDAERLEMARLAVEKEKDIEASDYEFHLPLPSYSIATLRALRQAYPECEFRMLIGGDNLENIKKWKEPEAIIREFGLIVYPRPGSEIDLDALRLDVDLRERIWIMKDVPLMEVSSTQIRRLAHEGKPIKGLVPADVAEYIRRKGIY